MAAQRGELVLQVKRHPWEARHEWEARLDFVEDRLEAFGLQKALNLSMVWANIHFLGCSYPPNTEAMVAGYRPRETGSPKRKRSSNDASGSSSKYPRTENDNRVVADTVSALISSVRREARVVEEEGEGEWEGKKMDASDEGPAGGVEGAGEEEGEGEGEGEGSEGNDVITVEVPAFVPQIADKMCLCVECVGNVKREHPVTILDVVFNRYRTKYSPSFTYEYVFSNVSNKFRCVLTVGGKPGTDTVLSCKKDAKRFVAEQFLLALRRYQLTHGEPPCPKKLNKGVVIKSSHVERADLVDGGSSGSNIGGGELAPLPESNKGRQMLVRMGWKDDSGLGPQGKAGITEPILCDEMMAAGDYSAGSRHLGLGSKAAATAAGGDCKLSQASLKQKLHDFITSDLNELQFSSDLTKDERATIHSLCLQYGLLSRSHGKNESRTLVVSKKMT